MTKRAAVDAVENMKLLSSHRFIVWTQAGFKKACKLVATDGEEVRKYPDVYPSVVTFSRHYAGYDYYYASCRALSAAIEDARSLHQLLLDTDAQHKAQLSKRQTMSKLTVTNDNPQVEVLVSDIDQLQSKSRMGRSNPTKAVLSLRNVVSADQCSDANSPRGYVALPDVLAACEAAQVVAVVEYGINDEAVTSTVAKQARNETVDEVMAILNSPYRATGAISLLTQIATLVEKLRV